MGKYTTVSIPTPLAENVKKQIQGTGFTSVSDYVTFVLREVLSHSGPGAKGDVSVKTKLKALGYI
ncbi:MAG: CopG family transcriptional regulator [Candidatus Micrarchaeota archaeon]|nr:CopG family transcriptional regulator [Candidatus Micrarchaeota archaeon]